ncbi:hypothetical protein QOT17_004118 [Balamuthia mandrillaris]
MSGGRGKAWTAEELKVVSDAIKSFNGDWEKACPMLMKDFGKSRSVAAIQRKWKELLSSKKMELKKKAPSTSVIHDLFALRNSMRRTAEPVLDQEAEEATGFSEEEEEGEEKKEEEEEELPEPQYQKVAVQQHNTHYTSPTQRLKRKRLSSSSPLPHQLTPLPQQDIWFWRAQTTDAVVLVLRNLPGYRVEVKRDEIEQNKIWVIIKRLPLLEVELQAIFSAMQLHGVGQDAWRSANQAKTFQFPLIFSNRLEWSSTWQMIEKGGFYFWTIPFST